MSVRSRVRIGLAVISANSAVFLALYAWNLSHMSEEIVEVRSASLLTRSLTVEIASCITALELQVGKYLARKDAETAQEVTNMAEKCASLFSPESVPVLPLERLETHRALIRDYAATALKIGGSSARAGALRAAAGRIERDAKGAQEIGADRGIVMSLEAFVLEARRHIEERSAFVEEATGLRLDRLRTMLNDDQVIPTATSEKIRAGVAELERAIANWNRHLGSLESRFQSERMTVARLPAELPVNYVEQIASRSNRALDSLKIMGFWGGLSMALLIGLLLATFRWVGSTWNEAMQRLNRLCGRILSGQDEVRTEIQHLCEQAAQQEDLGVAYSAIGRTLGELNQLRQSLEEKVEERTKELRDAQQQLVQSGKLAALGTLAAGVAHELNNPLTIILGLSEEFDYPNARPERRTKIPTLIKTQVLRMARIIEQLKRLARKSDGQANELVRLSTTINNSIVLLGSKLKHASIELRIEIGGDVNVICDPVRLESVFSNLIQNAADALESMQRPVRSITVKSEVRAEGSLLVRVIDNGPGISEEVLTKIFEPFFTTKEVNRGTGLGLSLCHQIIEEMGGRFWVESEVGVGTTFLFKLPAVRIEAGVKAA